MIDYTGLAAVLRRDGPLAIESNAGRSLIAFAKEVGLASYVGDALEDLSRTDERSTDDQYAWHIRAAFLKHGIEKRDLDQEFTFFVSSLLTGVREKDMAEKMGKRVYDAKNATGEPIVNNKFARTHIGSTLTMLSDIGLHHIYDPSAWNPYISLAYHDLRTAHHIADVMILGGRGDTAVSALRLARRLNGIALETMASLSGPSVFELEAICFEIGEALDDDDDGELLNLFLELWSRAVESKSDILNHFKENKPRSGFFSKVDPAEHIAQGPVDLLSLAKNMTEPTPDLPRATMKQMHLTEIPLPFNDAVTSAGICDDREYEAEMQTLYPCLTPTIMLCSGALLASSTVTA